MTVSINKNEIFFNNVIVEKSKPQELTMVLKKQNRIIDLDESVFLYIYDEEGLRFWIDNSIIKEFQVFFKISENKRVFPDREFTGNLTILNFKITKDLNKKIISENIAFTQDSDDLHYGINSATVNEIPNCKIFFDSNDIIQKVSF